MLLNLYFRLLLLLALAFMAMPLFLILCLFVFVSVSMEINVSNEINSLNPETATHRKKRQLTTIMVDIPNVGLYSCR